MIENEQVKTAIRWRPTDDNNKDVILEKVNDQILGFGTQKKSFVFDHIFNCSDQNKVYQILVKPLVEKSFEGYNCTFLASGQTGTGKTYTMGFGREVHSENNGITPRVLGSIFSYQNANRAIVEISISFIEVYKDRAFDLLGKNPEEPLVKNERKSTKKVVQTENQVLALLTRGIKNRRVGCTNMNSTSSRSHAIFTIYLGIENADKMKRESVINLVDLAGSECQGKTGNTGKALVEGKSINESLSAFKRVITAMSSKNRKNTHIPFRDSVVTNILRDSLKINSYLALLGCVSPFESDKGETLSMLSFVAEAKLIKRTPQLNDVINEFQTPVKAPFGTSNSSSRYESPLKRPFPLSAIQNKSLRLRSRFISEPNRRSIIGNSSAHKRQSRLSIPNFNTNKRSSSNILDSPSCDGAKRPKAVNNPSPATASRNAIDASMHYDEFNWSEAFTSSAMDGIGRRFDSPLTMKRSARTTSGADDLLKIVNNLEKALKEQMMDGKDIGQNAITDMIGKLKNKLNGQNPTIDVSFHPAVPRTPLKPPMLSTVVEDEVSETNLSEDIDANTNEITSTCWEVEPIKEQTVLFSSPNEPTEPTDDPSPITGPHLTVDVAINYDQVENKIFFEMDNTNKDVTIIALTATSIDQPNSGQCTSISKSDSFLRKSLGAAESQDEPMDLNDNAIEATVSSTTIGNSPKLFKRAMDENVRTPIGKLVFRRVAPSCNFEKTRYAVEMINRPRKPLEMLETTPLRMNFDESTTSSTPCCLPKKSAIANRANHSRLRCPSSARVKLHRINTLQEYQQHCGEQDEPQAASKAKRKHRTKSTRTTENGKKAKLQLSETDARSRCLEILNTGSEKELKKLPVIGEKTAQKIFNFRNANGRFESIDGLLKIPYWSKKKHEKFIASNIF